MKNKLVVEENIDKKEYKPIIKITMEDEEFIIYTKDEINKLGDVICYVSSYCYEDGKQVLKPIKDKSCLLYTSPSPRDGRRSRMPSSA